MQTIEQYLPPFHQTHLMATRLPILEGHYITASLGTTATITAAQLATGYIINTGTGATFTLPTGTLFGNYLGAQQGDTFTFYVDNTAGTGTVTIAVGTNAIASAFGGTLTLVSGATGIAQYTVMFASPTAYVFSRTG